MIKKLKNELDYFLTNQEDKILVLKGDWGVGKTFFWNLFFKNEDIENTIKMDTKTKKYLENNYINYSYVSLFSVSNLSELKSKIFNESNVINDTPSIWNGSITFNKIIIYIIFIGFLLFFKPIISLSDQYSIIISISIFLILFWSNTYLTINGLTKKRSLKKIFSPEFFSIKYASKALNELNKSGIIKKFLGDHTNFIESNYLKNMIICFDDIERIDLNFSLRTLMGYADELAQQKNCKIILILNEDALSDEQKDTFKTYREKVIDVELTYQPILEEQLKIVFDDQLKKYSIIQEVINNRLGQGFFIKNIRILKKIKNHIDDLSVMASSHSNINILITNDFIKHSIFLSYCYYILNNKENIPFELIKNNELTEYFDDESNDTNKYSDLLDIRKSLNMERPSIFSEEIIHKLEHGYWNRETIHEIVKNWTNNIAWNTEKARIIALAQPAWDLYHNSILDHSVEIASIFYSIINNSAHYQYLDIIDFLMHLNYAWEFENTHSNVKPREYYKFISQYIETNPNVSLEYKENSFHYSNALFSRGINKNLVKFFKRKIRNTNKIVSNQLSLEVIATKLLDQEKPLTTKELNFLKNATENEFYQWINSKDKDPDLHYKIKNMLNYPEFQSSKGKMTDALIKLSNINNLNKKRMKKFLPLLQ